MAKENTPIHNIHQAEIIAHLILKIEQMDHTYVDEISNEIYKYQPFYLSTLLGFSYDVSEEELCEIMKIYFLVWECFKAQPSVKKKKVKEKDFARVFKKIARSIENGVKSGISPTTPPQDFQELKSKALLANIMRLFNSNGVLINMDTEMRMMALIGLISFIECFETI